MPPRRKLPSRRARPSRYPASPPAPTIEAMEVDESGEDMEVSDDDVQVEGDDAGPTGSEVDQEDELDVVDNEQDVQAEEEEEQEDELSSSESPTPPPKPTKAKSSPSKPRLKIKLKFSGVAPSNATPTPSDEMPLKPGRKGHPKHVDVESEDDDDDGESTPSTSYAAPTRLTQRQAALAGMVDAAEHVVLEETVSKKKKHLNETEMALKREETARKRKHLSAKKLEDEKTETINRLLKKQTRVRGKKVANGAAEDEEEQEGEEVAVVAAPPAVPTLFRWISTSKSDSPTLSFSVPPSLLPESDTARNLQSVNPPSSTPTPLCDIKGCTLPRKYKLVRDPSKGGCGMEHLKALQVI